MKDKNNFNSKKFQKEVFEEYKKLVRKTEEFKNYLETGYLKVDNDPLFLRLGLISKGFYKLFSFVPYKGLKMYFEHPDTIKLQNKATEIIYNPKVKEILCSIFKRKLTDDLFQEALEIEVVCIVTTSLNKDKIAKELSIDRDIDLFAWIIFTILNGEIDNYCRK
ncbi:MAG: hypothetical protein ACR2J3_04380 [Aridibacter sp.]